MEIWKQHPSLPIEVSNIGNVKNLYGRVLRLNDNNRGYYKCSIYSVVHRLVAQTFIENPENKPLVNHKNGLKKDNRAENLEWATYSENFIHAIATGLNPNGKGANNPRSKKIQQIDLDGRIVRVFNSANEVQRETPFKQANVSRCATGQFKTAYGFKWKYI